MDFITNTGGESTTPRLLLNAAETADSLGISRRKLWALTNCGEIRCIRIGRSVRYSVDDLRDWIAAQKTEGAGQ